MRAVALASALAAAVLLPGEPLGIGVLVVSSGVAATVFLAGKRGFEAGFAGSLALGLASIAVLRDAGWVVAIDLAFAWVLACVAAAGHRLTALLAPLARLADIRTLGPALPPGIGAPARGTTAAFCLVAPFAALFWAADPVFAALLDGFPRPSAGGIPGDALTFVLVLSAALGLSLASRRPISTWSPLPKKGVGFWEWAIPLALLDLLFVAFLGAQLAALIGGDDYVRRTANLTYAEYGRSGFWQLLAVAALSLAVIGSATLLAKTAKRPHGLLLKVLLGILCLLTLVVVVSALRRMLLYEDAYGLTRLRLLVMAFTCWLGAGFALIFLAGGIRIVRASLARVATYGTAVALIAFSLANPDGLIAERNVDRWREGGRLDVYYLSGLSADAAPALTELPPALRREVLLPLRERLAESERWGSFNLSRITARELLFAGKREVQGH